MAEKEAQLSPPESLLQLIDNLSRFHREHEEYYSQAPAVGFAGTDDLNTPGLVAESGVLFMEGEGEPAELQRLKREVGLVADDVEQTGSWLARAMEQAWEIAGSLAAYPALADVLGERHRIISNDWQSAALQSLVARLLRRTLDVLARVDFAPAALRADLGGERKAPAYLYSASELLDRAADLMTESAMLVHDNERRWRIFRARVRELQSA